MDTESGDIVPPEWLDQKIFPFRNRRTHILGHEIHYIDEGQGPTLLLLHGNGSWSFGFRLAIPLLTSRFRVIALDYPGFGLSKASPGFSFKPEDHSQVVEKFIDDLRLEDIRLFVEDWGGPIGLGLAGRRPELIHSLIISNTWAWPSQGSPNLERFSNLAGSFIGHFLITRFNILTWLLVPNMIIAKKMTKAERMGYYMPYPTPESRQGQAIFPREILASHIYLKKVEDGLENLLSKPVLIVWGERDPAFGENEMNRFSRTFEHATVLKLPNAKHFVLVDDPDRSVGAILEFDRNDA